MEVSSKIVKNLSLRGGIYYAIKGSEFQSPIEGKYDVAEGIFGLQLPFPLEVNYTGTVTGVYENRYLDFPIYLHFRPLKRVSVGAGYQYSKLLKGHMAGTVDVKALLLNFNNQEFDQTELIRSSDQSVLAEFGFQITNTLNLKLRGSMSMSGICLLYTSPSPRDATLSRMPSSA